ncbi:MAG: hypothetical protein V1916_02340 [Patescibacteria group bacterium]
MATSQKYFGILLLVVFTVCATIIAGIVFLDKENTELLQLVFGVIITGIAVYFTVKLSKTKYNLRSWSEQHGIGYRPINCYKEIWQRFDVSPEKKFLNARKVHYKDPPPLTTVWGQMNTREEQRYFVDGPFASGTIGNRNIWIYKIDGNLHVASVTWTSLFFGWCMELSIHSIPVSVSVHKRFIGHHDKLDTESVAFEKLYDVDVVREGKVLQLLDPVMMELILHSGISAIEFSDSSIILFHTIFPPTKEDLDKYLDCGIKIAEQVDRNFPLGKYEKN